MKELYRKLFYVPEEGKVTEKMLQTQLAVSVLTILLCMTMMTLSAYAFFTSEVTSQTNVIQAAQYEIAVEEVPDGAALGPDGYYYIENIPAVLETVETTADEETGAETTVTTYAYDAVPTEYSFVLTKTGTASSAYCIIEMLTDVDGFTEPQVTYSRVFMSGDDSEVVTVRVPAGNTLKIQFIPEWSVQYAPVYLSDGVIEPVYGTPALPVLPETKTEVTEAKPEEQPEGEAGTEGEEGAEGEQGTEGEQGAEDEEGTEGEVGGQPTGDAEPGQPGNTEGEQGAEEKGGDNQEGQQPDGAAESGQLGNTEGGQPGEGGQQDSGDQPADTSEGEPGSASGSEQGGEPPAQPEDTLGGEISVQPESGQAAEPVQSEPAPLSESESTAETTTL